MTEHTVPAQPAACGLHPRTFSCMATALAAAGLFSHPALAQPEPFGIDFVTVGAPGNRATLPDETPLDPDRPRGAVDYEFRIAREPLAASQYLVFANAYGPYVRDLGTALQVASNWLNMHLQTDGSWRFSLRDDWSNVAAMTDFEMAARLVNWLHNDQAAEQWAFEGGVYDTSTFAHTIPPPHQLTPAPGARFWIPSLDELTKAVYYDPDKGGPGVGGYWLYPNSSDTPLVAGLPGTGAESIGDTLITTNRTLGEWALGQYPATQTPWGLLDVSATVPALTSTLAGSSGSMSAVGSLAQSHFFAQFDRIDGDTRGDMWFGLGSAIRLASPIPSPGLMALLPAVALSRFRRRR